MREKRNYVILATLSMILLSVAIFILIKASSTKHNLQQNGVKINLTEPSDNLKNISKNNTKPNVTRIFSKMVCLLEKNTNSPIKNMDIKLTAEDGKLFFSQTDSKGNFYFPRFGKYNIAPKKWGFKPTNVIIKKDTNKIFVEGVGRIRLNFHGEHQEQGFALLFPYEYLESFLKIRNFIMDPIKFKKIIYSKLPNELRNIYDKWYREFYAKTDSLLWEDVPIGKTWGILISHPKIYKVMPMCSKWTGEVFYAFEKGIKKEIFKIPDLEYLPPCPFSDKQKLKAGDINKIDAYFLETTKLKVYLNSFTYASYVEVTIEMKRVLQNGYSGLDPIFEWSGKPKSFIEISGLCQGDYILETTVLFEKEKKLVFSNIGFKIRNERYKELYPNTGIGPYRIWVSNSLGKWKKGWLITYNIYKEHSKQRDFTKGGIFNIPKDIYGELEVVGLFGKKGEFKIWDKDIIILNFDLDRKFRYSINIK